MNVQRFLLFFRWVMELNSIGVRDTIFSSFYSKPSMSMPISLSLPPLHSHPPHSWFHLDFNQQVSAIVVYCRLSLLCAALFDKWISRTKTLFAHSAMRRWRWQQQQRLQGNIIYHQNECGEKWVDFLTSTHIKHSMNDAIHRMDFTFDWEIECQWLCVRVMCVHMKIHFIYAYIYYLD